VLSIPSERGATRGYIMRILAAIHGGFRLGDLDVGNQLVDALLTIVERTRSRRGGQQISRHDAV